MQGTDLKQLTTIITKSANQESKSLGSLPYHDDQTLHLLESTLAVIENHMVWLTSEGRAIFANRSCLDVLEFTQEEIIGKYVWDWDPLFPKTVWPSFWQEVQSKKSVQFESIHTTKSGHQFPVLINAFLSLHAGKEYLIAIAKDISDVKKSEEQHRQKAKGLASQYRQLFENMLNGVALHKAVVNKDGDIIDLTYIAANKVFENHVGLKREQIMGRTVSQAVPGFEESSLLKDYATVIRTGKSKVFELYFEPLNKWFSISAYRPSEGHLVTVSDDITDRKIAEEALQQLAYFDPLTKLPNRSAIENRLEEIISRANRENYSLGIFFIDIDNFKHINDAHGHHVGDKMLTKIAEMFSTRLRREDFIGRLGGDEFLLIIENCESRDKLTQIAGGLVELFECPITLDETSRLFTTLSIGIAVYPDDGENKTALFKNADIALYHAKSMGKNAFHFFESHLGQQVSKRVSIERKLRNAIASQHFKVFFQPIVDTKTEQVKSAEALIRWIDPEEGFISPADFIPIAEDSGLIVEIGNWVIDEVCKQIDLWQSQGFELPISINVSAKQVATKELHFQLMTSLNNYRVDAEMLMLEITEGVLMENQTITQAALSKLKDLGLSVAIDDFGTGYSSLSYLKKFDIDCLKIDRSFISDLPDDHDDAQITKAIISMANSLNLKVIAEGVETDAQREFLQRSDCQLYQGYLKSKPVDAEVFTELLLSLPKQ